MFGTVRDVGDGRVELRFERRLPHPPEKVWRALTEIDELRSWFVEILDYDRSRLVFAEGASLEFAAKGDLPTGHGRVTACDPPSLLEYTWDEETLRWELAPSGADCLLVFTNTLPDRDTADAVEPGWRAGLDQLAAALGSSSALH